MEINRCQHIKTNGQQCGSPALRGAAVCYFHGSLGHTQHLTINQAGYYPSPSPETLTLPVLEDYESVQMAIMQVLQKLTTGHLDRKTAGLLLYGLQIASSNLRYARFDPRAESVVIDPMATHLTPLDGDQWSDEEDEENYDEEGDDGKGGDEEGLSEAEEDLLEEDLNEERVGADAAVRPQVKREHGGDYALVETGLRPVSEYGAGIPARVADADAPARAERRRPHEQSQPQKQEPPRIPEAQFLQAMANFVDHVENGTALKFPVYPARPPAALDSGTVGKRKNGNGSS